MDRNNRIKSISTQCIILLRSSFGSMVLGFKSLKYGSLSESKSKGESRSLNQSETESLYESAQSVPKPVTQILTRSKSAPVKDSTGQSQHRSKSASHIQSAPVKVSITYTVSTG